MRQNYGTYAEYCLTVRTANAVTYALYGTECACGQAQAACTLWAASSQYYRRREKQRACKHTAAVRVQQVQHGCGGQLAKQRAALAA